MADFLFTDARPLALTEKFLRINWVLLAAIACLAAIGTMSLYSTAGGQMQPWAQTHALRFIFAAGVAIGIALINVRVWAALANPLYLATLGLLFLVPLIGNTVMGARRWVEFAGLTVQPSEMMKVGLVIALARYFQWLGPNAVSRPRNVAIALLIIALPVVLTLRQPDLGTGVLFAIVGLGIMFAAGVSIFYFLAGGVGAALLSPVIWWNLHDYQRKRVETFLNPDADPLGASYHITQSKIAFGSGGVSGRGFLNGTQSQLGFLPEKHTDFIFTMFGEEWGLLGCLLVLALFALVALSLLIMAIGARSEFARLIIVGTGLLIFTHMFINVAMVTGLVPVVGVPLPFVSYGGSSITTLMICIGLAMSAHVHVNERLLRLRKGPGWAGAFW
jgi:rod shape determining protein RodA